MKVIINEELDRSYIKKFHHIVQFSTYSEAVEYCKIYNIPISKITYDAYNDPYIYFTKSEWRKYINSMDR